MKRMRRTLPALVLGIALSCPAWAAGNSDDNANGPDFDAIRAEQSELRGQAVSGKGIFEDISSAKRDDLVSKQDRLLAMLEGKQGIEDLNDKEQVTAFNLLQSINETVNGVEEEQQVRCTHQSKTGSHRKFKVCKTLAQRKREREASQRLMRTIQRGYILPIEGI